MSCAALKLVLCCANTRITGTRVIVSIIVKLHLFDLLWTCCGLVVDLLYSISTCCGFVVDLLPYNAITL